MSITYEILKYNKDLGNSILELIIKGDDINYIIINTIRRTILSDIPIYAFNEFNFTTNESIFNNNYIKLRLINMPVWGIPNKNDKFIKENNKKDIIDEDFIEDDVDIGNETKVNTSSLNQLTMYVNYKNNEKIIKTVTTDDAKFYYSNKNIDSPYPIQIPLIKLQPDQTINLSAITMLGTEKESAIYSAVSICYYNEINPNEFKFILESRGQINEKRIIEVALINIINKLEKLIEIIPLEQNSHIGEVIINNENNTIGNLLSNGMQNHKNVKFAGYNIPHLLENKVIIHYELINEKIKLKDVFNDVIINLLEIFKTLMKLNNKDIDNNINNLFPETDYSKIQYDSEGLYSLTIPSEAEETSNLIKSHFKNKSLNIFDGNGGLGGNTINFAKNFKNVTTCEINEERYKMLVNNIKQYDLDNVKTYNTDSVDYLFENYPEFDVYFFDPPWGGPSYKKHKKLLLKIGDKSLLEIANFLKPKVNNKLLLYKLPSNYDLNEFSDFKYKKHKINKYYIIIIKL